VFLLSSIYVVRVRVKSKEGFSSAEMLVSEFSPPLTTNVLELLAERFETLSTEMLLTKITA
jgi:hypothetical protein